MDSKKWYDFAKDGSSQSSTKKQEDRRMKGKQYRMEMIASSPQAQSGRCTCGRKVSLQQAKKRWDLGKSEISADAREFIKRSDFRLGITTI